MGKLVFAIFMGLAVFVNAQEKKTVITNNIHCEFSVLNGEFHGPYSSWYENGQKRSEGEFYHNNRYGTWKIWDSIGNLKVKRKYENQFQLKKIIPKVRKNKSLKLLNNYVYTPDRNEENYFDYYYLEERSVLHSSRYFNIILPEDNPILFDSNKILNMILELIMDHDITAYKIYENYQKDTIDIKNTDNKILLGLKTTEESVYDYERQISESRIVFISPVIKDTITDEIIDYWFYYEHLIPHLANIKLEIKEKQIDIENYSDLFFWDYYSYRKIRKITISENNKGISNEVFFDSGELKALKDKSFNLMIDEIENEHELLINYSK